MTRSIELTTSARAIIVVTLLCFCIPVVCDLALSGPSGPFHYFASDTFYYLTVARNIAQLGSATYDQSHLVNGFHPL